TGASEGTFAPSQNVAIEVGCASGFTIQRLDNSVFWLGNDGVVYRLDGYTPKRISTHAMEQQIQRGRMADAYAMAWSDRGHAVYYLTLPDGQTWGYDAASREWARRESYGLSFWRVNTL